MIAVGHVLQVIKNWTVGRPGNEATDVLLFITDSGPKICSWQNIWWQMNWTVP